MRESLSGQPTDCQALISLCADTHINANDGNARDASAAAAMPCGQNLLIYFPPPSRTVIVLVVVSRDEVVENIYMMVRGEQQKNRCDNARAEPCRFLLAKFETYSKRQRAYKEDLFIMMMRDNAMMRRLLARTLCSV